MADPFIGEIRLIAFTFAPVGWAECAGQLLPISQHDALFTLIGTTFGGDGQETFALPDYRGRAIVSAGSAGGGFLVGEAAGQEQVTLTQGGMPQHNHRMAGSSAPGKSPNPLDGVYAQMSNVTKADKLYGDPAGAAALSTMIAPAGGSQPHENRQPFLTLRYVIALEGIFPQFN